MISDLKHLGLFRVDVMRYVFDLPHQNIAEHCLDVIAEAKSYTSYGNRAAMKKLVDGFPERDRFEATLKKGADEFVQRTKRKSFARGGGHRLDYWCSVYREHDHHGSHIHPRSLISGTYYPMASKDSAALTLEPPWTNYLMHDTLALHHVLFDYRPDPGDCLMWPSWLNHRVGVQGKSDTPRIAISFNIDYVHEPDLPSAA